jgi:serine/threonine protein kinase
MHALTPPILHSDLKIQNLLVDDDGRIVVTDFGLARRDAGAGGCANPALDGQPTSAALTVGISPPEVLRNPRAPRTTAADAYAFGVVLLEIMTGQPAFRGLRVHDVGRLVCGGRRPPIPQDQVPADVAALITECWAQEAAQRPAFPAILDRLQTVLAHMEADSMHTTLGATTHTVMWTGL